MAPVDNETVQHQVSQSAGPHNAATVLDSVPAQLTSPAANQWRADSSTSSARYVSVVHRGGYGDTSVDS